MEHYKILEIFYPLAKPTNNIFLKKFPSEIIPNYMDDSDSLFIHRFYYYGSDL